MPQKTNQHYQVKRKGKQGSNKKSQSTVFDRFLSSQDPSSFEEREKMNRMILEKELLEQQAERERILAEARAKEAEYLAQEKLDVGREMTAAIIDRYGDKPLSELIKDSQRPKSMLIYKMMASSGISYSTMAYYLMCNPQSLRNKLSRDTFSLDDLIAAANVCGYEIVLRKKDGSEEFTVDADDFFKYSENEKMLEQWARLVLLKEGELKRKEMEMAQLQARMDQLRNELDCLQRENEQVRKNLSHDQNK